MSSRERLRAEQARREELAARALLENNPQAAEAHLRWRAAAAQLLPNDAPPRRHPLYTVLWISLLCLSLTLLAWTLRTGNNPLRLEARADSVTLRLAQDWSADLNWPLSRLSADGLRSVRSAPLGDGAYSRLSLDGTDARLRRLSLPVGALLILEQGPDGLRLFVKNGALRGEVALTQARARLQGEAEEQTLNIQALPGMPPEILSFAGTAGAQGRPLKLALSGAGPWRLDGLMISDAQFIREEPPGSNQWVSSLRQAKGRFLAVERDFDLLAGDWLKPRGLVSERLELLADESGLNLVLQGRAERLHGGPNGFIRDLTPSWLEYLYRQQSLSLLWGALLLLWGWAWKLRGLLK